MLYFQIHNSRRCEGSAYSCPRALSLFFPNEEEIHISGYQVHQGGRRCVLVSNPITLLASWLSVHYFPISFLPPVLINPKNIRLSLPQTIGNVFIERLADYLLVKSTFGFSLAWDGDSGVYLKMSEEHHGGPCGLCGNFNHIAGDDLTTARGKTGSAGLSSSFL